MNIVLVLKMTSIATFNATVRIYDEDFPLLMPRWGYVASAFVLFLIGFFGFFLNLMVILLMFKDRQLWTPLNIILFNLVCSDFSVSILGNPFTLISALFHRWVFGPTMCVMYGFFMALLGITSITTLTVISFERYMMVTKPLSQRHLTSKGAVIAIIFIWSYSLALTTPPLMGWGNYVNEAANISCSVNWHEQSVNTLTYILFLFAMGQIVPLGVITFSYVNIIRTMKKTSKRLGRVNRAEARATTMIFIMIVAFTIAWTPYSIFALMEQFATDGIISPGVGVIPALVAKSSICYDPLIYVGMNSQFQKSIKRIFGIHTKRTDSQTDRKNNTVTSPGHKMSSANDVTTKNNSCDTTSCAKKRDKSLLSDNILEVPDSKPIRLYPQNIELYPIIENKSMSHAEKLGETICDGETKNYNKSVTIKQISPTVTIIDSKRMTFSKYNKAKYQNKEKHTYGNQGYVEHPTDNTGFSQIIECQSSKKPKISHSYSFDLGSIRNDSKIRKISMEPNFETNNQFKGSFKDTVISKFFDHQVSKQNHDNFKSYLCSIDNENDDDIL